ncbi:hypothetical protein, partial [Salmonella sp. s50237]|uniref:hypothetical protein n=1 Tax=Salmonella sp. s50237 TaxID=3159649 RepID=UPI0039817739
MAQDGSGGSFFEDMPELPKIAQEKASGPLYGVVLRVIGQGSSKKRSSHIASNLINSIIAETRSKHNTLMPLSNGGYPFEKHIESVF